MIIISKRTFLLIVGFFIVLSSFVKLFSTPEAPVFSKNLSKTVVLDSGHGFPDGGAVGANGTIESTINIKVTKLAEKELKKHGYKIIMTRHNENGIYTSGETISEKKHSDMQNRLELINNSNADIMVSIHMNKFTDPRYSGAQVLYSPNFAQSRLLAETIQTSLHKIPENKTKRTALCAPAGIYLLKNASIPSVIVECGFLSNFLEEQNLNTKKYQKKIAHAIAGGILNYYKKVTENPQP